MRIGALLGLVGVGLVLVVPGSALAGTRVDTPQGHAAEDNVVLTPSAEARLSRESAANNAAARANVATVTGDPGVVGYWGPVVDWPVVAVNAALLPNGKVLAYDSIGDQATETYPVQDHTRATIWDPANPDPVTSQTPVWLMDGFNIFCSGVSVLTNGNLFIAGGNKDQQLDGIVQTHYFDWSQGTWSLGVNMAYARWYPTVTGMGNGEMLITSGGPAIPEVRQSDGTLRQLSNASLSLPLYPWFDVAPDGRAFDSGPDQTMRSLDPTGSGAWKIWSNRDSINRDYGSHAMYDVGKILVAGGGPSTNTADVIDVNG
ncbi:MAG: galactose oxidase-like domain-containing protein, partial [Solirubrobacteraceae bacterium]